GGPGGTNEVFENFAAELASLVSVSRGTTNWVHFSLINRTFPIRLIKSAFSISRIMLTKWKMFGNSWVLIIYLLGQSWGGVLANEYGLKYPQHLKGLILSSMIDNLDEYLVNINKIRETMFSSDDVAYMQRIEAQHAFANAKYQQLVRELGEQYLHHAKDPQPRHLISTLATPVYHHFQGDNEFVMVGALKDWDRRADIHRLTMPTYLTFGGHETMPLSAANRMAQTIPNATLHVTPN
ncbi:prolyl aminopeptidase, partial [Lacticaseibacillus rhamnosus MTCC 5462]